MNLAAFISWMKEKWEAMEAHMKANADNAVKLAALAKERDDAKAAGDKAAGELVTAKQTISERDAEIAGLKDNVKAKGEKIAELEKSKSTVGAEAAAIAAAQGIPAEKLPPVGAGSSAVSEMKRAEFVKLSPAARMKFCQGGGKVVD